MCLRNEGARERRRRWHEKGENLRWATPSDLVSASGEPPRRPILSDHFGWRVLNRAVVLDSTHPYMSAHWELPDISGGTFDKVTYVMYLDEEAQGGKDEGRTRETALKATQTEILTAAPAEEVETLSSKSSSINAEEAVTVVPRAKIRNLISDFYYVPREVRLKKKLEASGDNKNRVAEEVETETEQVDYEEDTAKEEKDVKKAPETPRRRRYKQDRWALRAGAENPLTSQYALCNLQKESKCSDLNHYQKCRSGSAHSVSTSPSSADRKPCEMKRNRTSELRNGSPAQKQISISEDILEDD
ncbi:hypothetical protein J6590_077449 [Homalodisca vitripennis]|nr:hypothetical protein J6590_077449 [Homalodisca vitripennis]